MSSERESERGGGGGRGRKGGVSLIPRDDRIAEYEREIERWLCFSVTGLSDILYLRSRARAYGRERVGGTFPDDRYDLGTGVAGARLSPGPSRKLRSYNYKLACT